VATSLSERQYFASATQVEYRERRIKDAEKQTNELRSRIWKLELKLDNLKFALIMAALLAAEITFFVVLGLATNS
jgi:hypothetical protein